MRVLGEDDLNTYVQRYNLTIPKEVRKMTRGKTYEKQPWSNFITDKNKHLVNDDAIDLLDKML